MLIDRASLVGFILKQGWKIVSPNDSPPDIYTNYIC